jgi:hypothetical protein
MKSPAGRSRRNPEPTGSEDAKTRSWIARAIVGVALGAFVVVGALAAAHDRDSLNTVVTYSHGLLLLVLGYYFGKRS